MSGQVRGTHWGVALSPQTASLSVRARAIVALVATAIVLGGWFVLHPSGIRTGHAMHDGSDGGIIQPLKPGEPLSLGLVPSWNISDEPIELVIGRVRRLDPGLEVLGFSVMPYSTPGGVPLTAVEHPLAGAVPLAAYPPLQPADDYQFVVLVALKLRPGAAAGYAEGIELTYRQGGELRTQRFGEQVYMCTSLDGECHDPAVDGPNDLDALLESR